MKISSNKIARIISTVFIPPSFTLFTFIAFAFWLENDYLKQAVIIVVAFIIGFIAPLLIYFVFRKAGKLNDKDASIKEERTLPFIIATGFYILGLLILINFDVNIISTAFWFCYISNTLLTIIINKHWKISAHTMGAAGPLAAITYAFGPINLTFSLLVFIVGWSRIKLKCHNLSQVLAGGLFAFISTYIQIYIIVNILSEVVF